MLSKLFILLLHIITCAYSICNKNIIFLPLYSGCHLSAHLPQHLPKLHLTGQSNWQAHLSVQSVQQQHREDGHRSTGSRQQGGHLYRPRRQRILVSAPDASFNVCHCFLFIHFILRVRVVHVWAIFASIVLLEFWASLLELNSQISRRSGEAKAMQSHSQALIAEIWSLCYPNDQSAITQISLQF